MKFLRKSSRSALTSFGAVAVEFALIMGVVILMVVATSGVMKAPIQQVNNCIVEMVASFMGAANGQGCQGSSTGVSSADDGSIGSSLTESGGSGEGGSGNGNNDGQANGAGSFCGGCNGVASVNAGTNLPNQTAGNPIHIPTGNKYQTGVDLDYPQLALRFVRHYNSHYTDRFSGMGYGWRLGYETHVLNVELIVGVSRKKRSKRITIEQGDGRKVIFDESQLAGVKDRYDGYLQADGYLQVEKDHVVWHWPNSQRIVFNAKGKMRSIEKAGSATQTISYNKQGRLTKIDSNRGGAIELRWSGNRITDITGPDGATVAYSYDVAGNLVGVQKNNNAATIYHYENAVYPHHLTGLTNGENVRFATWGYNSDGQAVLSKHIGDVGRVELYYEDGLTTLTNSLGEETRYHWEQKDHLTVVTKVEGVGCLQCGEGDNLYEYNADALLISQTGRDQVTRRYIRDEYQRIVSVTEQGEGEQESRQLVRFAYGQDKSGEGIDSRPTVIAKPSVVPGKETIAAIEYDAVGHVTSVKQQGWRPSVDGIEAVAMERQVQFTWQDGLLSAIDGPREDVNDVTEFTYDERGLLKQMDFANGKTVRVLSIDKAGRPTQLQHNERAPWTLTYSPGGKIASISRGELRRDFEYKDGKIISVSDTTGRQMRFEYDQAGRLVAWQDGRGRGEAFEIDTENQLTKRRHTGLGNEELWYTDYLYNKHGQLSYERSLDGVSTQVDYDERGRMTTATEFDEDNSVNTAQWEYAWTAANWLETVSVIDKEAQASEFDRDKQEQLQEFSYDQEGLLNGIVDGNASKTTFQFDDFDNLVAEHSPDSGLKIYHYDLTNNLTQSIDAQGQITRYDYDAANQLTTITDNDGNETRLNYTQDQLDSIANDNQSEHYRYDELGRVSQRDVIWDGKVKKTLSTAYDSQGRIYTEKLASGKTVRYDYNAHGEISQMFLDGKSLLLNANTDNDTFAQKSYQLGNGEQVTRFYSNGLLVGMDVNGASGQQGTVQAQNQSQSLSNQAKLSRRWDYDNRGNLYQGSHSGAQEHFDYDGRDRLIAASLPAGDAEFDYDANNNRLKAIINNETQAFSYERLSNQIAKIFTVGYQQEDTQTPQHDVAGNLTALGDKTYEYNASARLDNIKQNGKTIAEYAYNGWGERVKKTVTTQGSNGAHSKITYFLYNGHQLQAEVAADGKVIAEYLYLNNQAFAKITSKGVFYIHTNTRGAPEWMTDDNQQIAWQANYLPFGEITIETETENLSLRFPGQYHDYESDLYYNDHRYYQPEWGRYITADPSGLNGGINRYAYADVNPIMYIDPLGLSPCNTATARPRAREDGNTADAILEQQKLAVADGSVTGFFKFFGASLLQNAIGLGDFVFGGVVTDLDAQIDAGNSAFDAAQTVAEDTAKATIEDVKDIAQDVKDGNVLQAGGAIIVAVGSKTPLGRVADGAANKAGVKGKVRGDAANGAAKIKAGSAGGDGAGKAFSQKVKNQARQESGDKCVFCGTKTTNKPGPTRSEIDHSIPKSRGGNNTLENAQNTCRTCNRSKGAKTSGEFVKKKKS